MTLTPYNCKDCLDIYQISVNKQTLIEMTAYMFPPLRKDNDKIGKNEGVYHHKKPVIIIF